MISLLLEVQVISRNTWIDSVLYFAVLKGTLHFFENRLIFQLPKS